MAQPMPESVKWAEIHGLNQAPAAELGYPFGVKVARDEVMILLGLYYWWKGALAAGNNSFYVALWRKTDSDPPISTTTDGDSPDMVWHKKDAVKFVTESVVSSASEMVTFPWPIVLVRPPRAIVGTGLMTAATFSVRLYYLLREVNDVDLAKLMVKDHA